jgi:5-(carboxyamino)imidazole ribonucleotide mutase
MKPLVSIIMGSTSDLPVMEKAAALLNEFEIPFEINALSAHRTPKEVELFASKAQENGSTFARRNCLHDHTSCDWGTN